MTQAEPGSLGRMLAHCDAWHSCRLPQRPLRHSQLASSSSWWNRGQARHACPTLLDQTARQHERPACSSSSITPASPTRQPCATVAPIPMPPFPPTPGLSMSDASSLASSSVQSSPPPSLTTPWPANPPLTGDLDVARQRLCLILSVGHPHQVAEVDEVHAVACGADLRRSTAADGLRRPIGPWDPARQLAGGPVVPWQRRGSPSRWRSPLPVVPGYCCCFCCCCCCCSLSATSALLLMCHLPSSAGHPRRATPLPPAWFHHASRTPPSSCRSRRKATVALRYSLLPESNNHQHAVAAAAVPAAAAPPPRACHRTRHPRAPPAQHSSSSAPATLLAVGSSRALSQHPPTCW